jgi:RHS repeat-associated protein
LDRNAEITLSELTYDELGRVNSKKLHGGKDTIAYTYNIRNWLKTISSSNFIETLYYNESYAGNTPAFNGNISAMHWSNSAIANRQGYRYTYDDLNRIKKAQFLAGITATDRFTEEVSEYDKHGNIKRLKRYALNIPRATSGTLVDDLTLTYTGNQIKTITDAVSSSTSTIGFIPASTNLNYAYNKNGAFKADFNRGISGIQYNVLNLPEEITFSGNHSTLYSYDATGMKRRIIHVTAENVLAIKNPGTIWDKDLVANPASLESGTAGLATTSPVATSPATTSSTLSLPSVANTIPSLSRFTYTRDTTDYAGNIVYENGVLKYILTPEGYITKNGTTAIYNYYLKDHLGNNRVVMEVNGSSYSVIQKTDYYPFGMPYKDGTNPERQPYKFGGKEYDEMQGLNWYDFEARAYDGIVGRFPTTMDPLAEKYYAVSPYAYCNNNPVRYIDPTGKFFFAPAIPYIIYGIEALISYYTVKAAVEISQEASKQSHTTTSSSNIKKGDGTLDARASTPEDINNQRKNDRRAKEGLDKNQAEVAKSIDTNISGNMPNGDPAPKRDPKDGGKKTKVATGVVIVVGGVRAGLELTNPDPSKDAVEAHKDKAKQQQQAATETEHK